VTAFAGARNKQARVPATVAHSRRQEKLQLSYSRSEIPKLVVRLQLRDLRAEYLDPDESAICGKVGLMGIGGQG